MIFSTDVRESIAKWAKANGINLDSLVAFEERNPAPKYKPGVTYEPVSIPVDAPGMRFYKKVSTAPTAALPDFSKLEPDPAKPKPAVAAPKPVAKPTPKVEPKVEAKVAPKVAPKPTTTSTSSTSSWRKAKK